MVCRRKSFHILIRGVNIHNLSLILYYSELMFWICTHPNGFWEFWLLLTSTVRVWTSQVMKPPIQTTLSRKGEKLSFSFLAFPELGTNKKINTQYTHFLQKRVKPSNENWVKLCFNFVLMYYWNFLLGVWFLNWILLIFSARWIQKWVNSFKVL